jgi:hypothetical protein
MRSMKRILSEKNIVVLLFVLVLITFSLAQEDSKKIQKLYIGAGTQTAEHLVAPAPISPLIIE